MTKIFFIIPYDEIAELFKKEAALYKVPNVSMEFEHIYGTDYKKISSIDADIIVARGITSLAAQKYHPDKQIIHIPQSAGDFLEAVYRCRLIADGPVGILAGSASMCNADYVSTLIGQKVYLYTVLTQNDVREGITVLRGKGCTTFIGGMTMVRVCEEHKYSYVHVKTGEHAVKDAIARAISSALALENEKVRGNLFFALLNNSDDALVAVDSTGEIIVRNENAEKLGVSQEIIYELLKKSPQMSKSYLENTNRFLWKVNGTQVFITSQPVMVEKSGYVTLLTIHMVDHIQREESEIRKELAKKGLVAHYTFENILTRSPAMQACIDKAKQYSRVEGSILIIGETGTGKEIFAQSIHNASDRKNEPFVAVNCAALSEQLLESELFGYVPGAFTGADKAGKSGLFELAHKGTLFLDEIGEMPCFLQAKLLRVLQEHEVRRIGGDSVIPVDVRVISATNVNIIERIKNGQFRLDLFYRLGLFTIKLLPLRSRVNDIPLLFRNFVISFNEGRNVPEFTEDAMTVLKNYSWPGNVRELQNCAKRLSVLNSAKVVKAEDIEKLEIDFSELYTSSIADETKQKFTSSELYRMYQESGLSKEAFAKKMHMSRTTIWRKFAEIEK